MTETRVRQRLAAILAADAAGYTRLMQDDQVGTVAALDAARLVFREEIERAGGRVVDMAGDSVLGVFETATGAVRAALAAQKALESDSAKPRLRFRIGVHLGEIIEKPDGSVYGDGVNLAARLQALAAPGGVCISAAVSEQVGKRIDETFEDIGAHSVKNVAKPLHAFAWGGASVPAPAGHATKPTVAVGDFAAEGEAAALAAGARDGVAAALSNQTGLALVSGPANADYVVDASLQSLGNRYRATLRVLDRKAGRYFASERFDGALDDPFAAQDDLAYRLYSSIRFAIYGREAEIADERRDAGQSSESLLSKAANLMFQGDVTAYLQARAMLETVLSRDARNFMALAMKATSHLAESNAGYKAISAEDRAAAVTCARAAARLNERSDYVHFVLSLVEFFCRADFEAARREAERSLELNPYFALSLDALGTALICSGRAEEGLALCRKSVDANPRSPYAFWALQHVGLGEFVIGRYDAAIDWAKRSDQRQPDVARTLLILAVAAAHAGDDAGARHAAERLMACHPEFRIRDFGNWPFRDPEPARRLLEGLRLAGLPD